MSAFEKLADLREQQQKTIVQGQHRGLDEPVSRFDGEIQDQGSPQADRDRPAGDLTSVQAILGPSIERESPFSTAGQSSFGVRHAEHRSPEK
ncbi:hypothetical protein [Variovorax atrisoli]|uniref:hypothetical protein n=1 Tax=Variovorax atrisoli TaxID=3394203 RepID=UPI003398BE0D